MQIVEMHGRKAACSKTNNVGGIDFNRADRLWGEHEIWIQLWWMIAHNDQGLTAMPYLTIVSDLVVFLILF